MLTRRQILAAPAFLRAQSRRPNILLLMTDQQRGDCMGADGNRVILTPSLDRIATEGVRFRRAYSSTPTCTPARAALLTGLSPWNHGMLGYSRIAGQYPAEMPRMLRDAGYFTAVIGKCHYHPQRNLHGFHLGLLDESGREESKEFRSDYRSWFYGQAPALNPDETGIGWNDYRAKAYALREELHPTRWMGDTAVRFLDSYRRAEPFFLKVSFARPHSPYDPPERFLRMYQDADIPKATAGAWASRWAPRSDGSNDIWHGNMGAEQVARQSSSCATGLRLVSGRCRSKAGRKARWERSGFWGHPTTTRFARRASTTLLRPTRSNGSSCGCTDSRLGNQNRFAGSKRDLERA